MQACSEALPANSSAHKQLGLKISLQCTCGQVDELVGAAGEEVHVGALGARDVPVLQPGQLPEQHVAHAAGRAGEVQVRGRRRARVGRVREAQLLRQRAQLLRALRAYCCSLSGLLNCA